MAQDFFLIPTNETRTASGIILPHKEGLILGVVGTLATEWVREQVKDTPDAVIEPHEAAVLVQLPVFMDAARQLLQSQVQPPPQ
jgi:hypothetical protein